MISPPRPRPIEARGDSFPSMADSPPTAVPAPPSTSALTRRPACPMQAAIAMKLDATLLTADPASAGSAARALEAQGFDGIQSFEGPHDPFLPLAVAAQHTQRVELATA